jgi:hypothetical protein
MKLLLLSLTLSFAFAASTPLSPILKDDPDPFCAPKCGDPVK